MSEPANERTVNVKQAMALCGVSARTVYLWVQKGKVRFKKTTGGGLRIYESSLWQPEKLQDAEKRDPSSST